MTSKVLTVFGTRPEAIKMAPIVRELERRGDRFVSRVCVTAQHRELLDGVLDGFGITPDHDLDLMRPEQSPADFASDALRRIDRVFEAERPDWVLVQGDTTTTMVGALAAFYRRIRVGHVEAGLRTFDRHAPFPEEMHRVLTDCLADECFVHSEGARAHLLREGISPARIHLTGNTVVDAIELARTIVAREPRRAHPAIAEDEAVVLVTVHRRESFGAPLERIATVIRELGARFGHAHRFVLPVHPNPAVRDTIERVLANQPGVLLVEPLGYFDLVRLLGQAHLVLTDSGGLQEEAPTFGVPLIVLREKVERMEGVEAGVATIVGTSPEAITAETTRLLTDETAYRAMARKVSPYGDGHAAERIVDVLAG